MSSEHSSPVRVVIDTNIWVSYLIGKCLGDLTSPLEKDQIRLLHSEESFYELIQVVQRPKLRQYFVEQDIRELIELVNFRTHWIDVAEEANACRDPKDNFLLDLSWFGKADYLVTGDHDLLVLEQWGHTRIVDYREFDKYVADLPQDG